MPAEKPRSDPPHNEPTWDIPPCTTVAGKLFFGLSFIGLLVASPGHIGAAYIASTPKRRLSKNQEWRSDGSKMLVFAGLFTASVLYNLQRVRSVGVYSVAPVFKCTMVGIAVYSFG